MSYPLRNTDPAEDPGSFDGDSDDLDLDGVGDLDNLEFSKAIGEYDIIVSIMNRSFESLTIELNNDFALWIGLFFTLLLTGDFSGV